MEDEDTTKCEGCSKIIKDGDLCSHDSINGINFCEECTPTWQNLANEPESFTHGDDDAGDPIYMTKETAAPVIAKHLAEGGKMTDKVGLRAY